MTSGIIKVEVSVTHTFINGGMQVVSMKNNQLFSIVKPVSATIFVGVDGNLCHPV